MSNEYPEHEKMLATKEEIQAVGEFLDWLSGQGIELCSFERKHGEGEMSPTGRLWVFDTGSYEPVRKPVTTWIAEFFGIDTEKIEAEKRQMLEEIRAVQAVSN